ncbi:MAG: DUF444 family protein [Planctomycetaceae bacterium]|jgi:uncharacterized protein|nr:DUF444 family protein [Planctomycetaceae bacterium]MBT6156092.1 DUF444 family protein [Planctomycetaceae bacterium]MBT6485141.1 DUF444 family protein [Planctomycetaceae bacterium]MBT6494731.1 DUF444 family protein [Planctomycetaceae bacterium]
MPRTIDRDMQRFKQIVRGKVRRNLRKYITHGEMIGRTGREMVSIPVPNIDTPRFKHGQRGSGGVGQGDGEEGQPIGRGQQEGDGQGQAGDQPGSHIREVEITLDELAEMLGDELELPNIEPKGKNAISSKKDRYTTIRPTGPDSLRHFKRTYKRALRRQISLNDYNPERPVIIPTRDDERYRSWKSVNEPEANAAIIYMMDVSGSMTDDQKEIVRIEAFWINAWLNKQYDGLERRYIVHDAVAHEVDEDTFYRTRESGGTRISSAFQAARKIITRDFPPDDWNIYCFQFSDGDNWGEDNDSCLDILKEHILPVCNLYCYGQVESPYGSGDFIRELRRFEDEWENLILSEIGSKDAIYDSIKEFLGTGR